MPDAIESVGDIGGDPAAVQDGGLAPHPLLANQAPRTSSIVPVAAFIRGTTSNESAELSCRSSPPLDATHCRLLRQDSATVKRLFELMPTHREALLIR
jgi:hypothetical protein